MSRGYRVELPLLAGHGTAWQDLERTDWVDWYGSAERAFDSLSAEVDQVAVCALSMGGSLAIRLAARRPVPALVLVNPSVRSNDVRMKALPVLSRVVRSLPAIGDDIAKPGMSEHAYPRTPLRAAAALTRLWKEVRHDLPHVTSPLLMFSSAVDHVVDPSSAQLIRSTIGSTDITEVGLPNSYHVATLDYDAPTIFDQTAAFVDRLTAQE